MAPAQGPTPSSNSEKMISNTTNKTRKQKQKNRRKAIPLDDTSLTFLTTRCNHEDDIRDEESKSQVNVDFFSAVLESVKPSVFFALDTRVCLCC